MKPQILHVIHDHNNNVLFTYPLNTLLDKIVDQWPLIMNYHENYYPFAVGTPDDNYREVTSDDLDSEMFMKLFIITYKKNKIKTHNFQCPGVDVLFISINGLRLCVTDDILQYTKHIATIKKPELIYDHISNEYIQNSLVPRETFIQIEEINADIKYVNFNIEPNDIKKIYVSKRKHYHFSVYRLDAPLLILSHIDL